MGRTESVGWASLLLICCILLRASSAFCMSLTRRDEKSLFEHSVGESCLEQLQFYKKR